MNTTRSLTKSTTSSLGSFKLQKVTRTSLSEDIVRQILALISTGDLKPGNRLPSERELCRYFGVGRSSLREAIHSLVMLGILEVSVGNGTFMAANPNRFIRNIFEWRLLTEHNMEDLMEVRLALECAACARAALNRTEAQLQKLESTLKKMERTVEQPTRFMAHDLEFHVLIAEASNNNLLLDLLYVIRKQLSTAVLTFVLMPGGAQLACKHHAALLKALRNRDVNDARSIMQTHLSSSLDRYLKAQATVRRGQLRRQVTKEKGKRSKD